MTSIITITSNDPLDVLLFDAASEHPNAEHVARKIHEPWIEFESRRLVARCAVNQFLQPVSQPSSGTGVKKLKCHSINCHPFESFPRATLARAYLRMADTMSP